MSTTTTFRNMKFVTKFRPIYQKNIIKVQPKQLPGFILSLLVTLKQQRKKENILFRKWKSGIKTDKLLEVDAERKLLAVITANMRDIPD